MTARRGRQAFRSRQAGRLSSWSINFAPEAASMSEGLRAAAACAAVAALAVLTHRNDLSWAAVSAFWTCLVDPGGPTRVRAKILAAYCVLATLIALLCTWAEGLGGAIPVIVLFTLTLAGGFIRLYGAEIAVLANLLTITAAVLVTRSVAASPDVVGFGIIFLGGCLWATALSLTVWRIHPYAPSRRAVRLAQEELAAMAMALSNLAGSPAGDAVWIVHAQQHRRAVRDAIEAARRVIGQAVAGRGGTGEIAAMLTSSLNAAEAEFACMIALTDTLERLGAGGETDRRLTAQALRRLAAVFHRVGRNAESEGAQAQVLERSLGHLVRAVDRLPEPVRRLMRDGVLQARRQLEHRDPGLDASAPRPPATPMVERVMGPLRANLHWGSPDLRHGLRLATSVTAAFLLTRAFHIPYGYWTTMTVVIIQQPYVSTTWTRAIERVIGSMLGGGLAALLGIVFHSQLALLALIFPLAIACMAFRAVNYTVFVFFLTPLFVLMIDLTHPGLREATLAGTRALNTVLGGAIALGGGMLLWPGSGLDRLRADLAEAVAANGKFAALACDPAGRESASLDAARRAAGLASNTAEAAQHRAALESWWRRDDLDAAAAMLAVLRRLAGTATTLWLERDGLRPRQAEIAAWCEQATDALAAALLNLRAPPAMPSAAPTDQHHPMAEEIIDLYAAAAELTAPRPKRGGRALLIRANSAS